MRAIVIVPKLEMHLSDACNLHCDGCAHFTNYDLPGVLSFERGAQWLRTWAERVDPIHFSYLGGEPTLNKRLTSFLELARELWPRARMQLITNGLLLERCASLWPVLAETRTCLVISIHSQEARYQARLKPPLELARQKSRELGFELKERDAIHGWYRIYHGFGADMEPFDQGRPHASWRVCTTRHCVTLRDNALWKCPPLAHLPAAARKLSLDRNERWRPYLSYEPLRPHATDDEIRMFFARGPESFCNMCPTRLEFYEKSVFRPRSAESTRAAQAE